MSENFWRLLSRLAGLLLAAAIFIFAYFTSHLEIKDLDLWLHIGTGRYIAQHGFQVPHVDILSCTVAGKPWNNHEWLFQVLVYELQKFWGMNAIVIMQVVVVLLTLVLLFFIGYNPEKQLVSVFSLLLVVLVYQSRFTTRPDLFSLLFFSSYILILSQCLGRRWSVYALLVVQVLWTNMHGFFFFGPLVVFLGLTGEWIKRHVPLPWEWNKVGRLDDDEYRRLKWILLFVVLACFLNPQGIVGAVYPLKVFTQISGESRVFFESIIELRKPITWGNILSLNEFPHYKLMILISFMSFFYNRRKIDVGIFLFWLFFLFFSLAAIRNLVFFAFAAYLVTVANAQSIEWGDFVPIQIKDRRFLSMMSIFLKGYLIFWIIQTAMGVSYNGYYDLNTLERKSEYGGVSQRSFPQKAVDFLVNNHVRGNFFNDFNSGAYLIGRCFPDIKVFMDGRTEVYGPKFFRYYKKVWGEAEGLPEALKKYQIAGAFLHSARGPIPDPTLRFFNSNKEWVPVYFDFDATIFLKDIPLNRDLIRRFRIDWAKRQPPPADLRRIGSKDIPVFPYVNRAISLQTMGYFDQAIIELKEALKINPANFEVYNLLGKIYIKQRNWQQAFESYRLAVIMNSHDSNSRYNLALAYYDLGEYGYAAIQYQKIIDLWPNSAKAYFWLAKSQAKQQQFDKSIAALRQGLMVDSGAQDEILEVGDIINEMKNYEKAKQAYTVALSVKGPHQDVYFKLGQIEKQTGNVEKARENWQRGLKDQPKDEELINALHQLDKGNSRDLPLGTCKDKGGKCPAANQRN